jgi:hypothetical protein
MLVECYQLEAPQTLILFWLLGSGVGGLTLFFSSRPRLFVRCFVPREELRGVVRAIVRDNRYSRAMRLMALLQFGFAAAFGAVGVLLWLMQGE